MTIAPALPATMVSYGGYGEMFVGCTSLTTAPELPATNLGMSCYSGMFAGCTSLTTAPELPAMTLAEDCYNQMFYGCTSLTTARDLSATTMAVRCCYQMFYGCTSLTTAPTLPAKTLKRMCYDCMFCGCTSLLTAPELPATTLTSSCYQGMFSGCTSLEVNDTAPGTEWKIQAMTEASYWGAEMFYGTAGTLKGQPALNKTYYIKSAPLPGSQENPWQIGADADDEVIAWTNGVGKLIIEGAGNMKEFAADGLDIPWPMSDISTVEISVDVTGIGYNAWHGLNDSVKYNGLSSTAARTLIDGFGGALGYARTSFKDIQVGGSIVQLAVALETTPSVTNEWTEVKLEKGSVDVDSNGRIIIQYQTENQDQGYYILQSVK